MFCLVVVVLTRMSGTYLNLNVHTTKYVSLVDILHGMSRVDGGLVNDRRRCSANKDA